MKTGVNKIEHIGIAVKSLDISIPLFEKLLGTNCYNIEEVQDQYVRTAFFLIGDIKIELLESINNEGPISNFITNKGEGIHHIAFKVDNVNESLKNSKEIGFKLIDNISRLGAEGLKIGFLNPRTTNNILIEFCSNEK
jgi:methylmalonyl-CoA/ethylmalonyl-CoA epimerase